MSHPALTRSTKFLRPNHGDFELVGKPALVLMHMQEGIAGEHLFLGKDLRPIAKEALAASGVVERCRALADAFRARDLPVIFVQAIPDPIGKVPAYGDVAGVAAMPDDAPGPNRAYRPFFTDEYVRRGLEVMPAMGYREGEHRDHVLYHWLINAFTNSGLDVVLKKEGCETIVWGGVPLTPSVYVSSVAAWDLGYNGIIPVDAGSIGGVRRPSVPEDEHERVLDVMAEAVVGFMAPHDNQVTDTATVLQKLEHFAVDGSLDGRR
ncbi:MAG TPA: isochorismatase family protein [Baekduia sp.]|nr:isochorismatase family protein [Baekduia sp.]